MSLVAAFDCKRRSVPGPSISGIITSSRIKSGCIASASANPCRPEEALATSQSASSKLRQATSRMWSSSSMIRIRLCDTGNLHGGVRAGHGVQQADDLLFELFDGHPSLEDELRWPEG